MDMHSPTNVGAGVNSEARQPLFVQRVDGSNLLRIYAAMNTASATTPMAFRMISPWDSWPLFIEIAADGGSQLWCVVGIVEQLFAHHNDIGWSIDTQLNSVAFHG